MNRVFDIENSQLKTGPILAARKNSHNLLINSQAFLSAIISNTNDMIWAVDRSFRIALFNRAFANYFGMRTGKKPYVGMAIEERVNGEELKRWKNYYSRALKGLHFTVDEKVNTPIKKFIYELSLNPIWEESMVIGISVFARDITARTNIETALAYSHEQYQTLIDTMGEGLAYADFTGKIIFVNKRLCHLLECNEADLVGKNGFTFVADKKLAEAVKVKLATTNNIMTDEYELPVRTKSGNIIWVHTCTSLVRNEAGNPVGIVATVLDITESKKNIDKLNIVNKDLQTFIYRASHDLRAPLSSILGLANAGSIFLKEPASLEFLDKMKMAATRMDSLLTDLTSIARLEGNEVKSDKIDVKKVIFDILATLNHMDGFKGMTFRVISRQNRDFFSDHSVVYSIMLNLLSNCIKFRKKGIANPWVKIFITPEKRGIKITVLDNGTGIKAELQNKVFSMFFRGNESIEGTGLGLYIVKLGTNKLNGKITLKSNHGKGTKFTLFLPCQAGQKPCDPA